MAEITAELRMPKTIPAELSKVSNP
jgi:xanthine dehydrogenase accessory factor